MLLIGSFSVIPSQFLRRPVRAHLNPFAPPFGESLEQQASVEFHNNVILRQTYPGYQIGRLPLDEYDKLVEKTRELIKPKGSDPIGDWFSSHGVMEAK